MANTYTQLYIHIVFSVKGRQALIPKKHHLKKTFREEYLAFLKHFGVAYDVKYIFDPVADLPAKE